MRQKVALVTGSSKGIGQETAVQLGKEGYFVYVTYRTDKKGGEKTVELIKSSEGNSCLSKLEVRDEQSVERLFSEIRERHGYLNLLVNNAAFEIAKRFEQSDLDDWKEVIDTMIYGNFLCVKNALPLLKKAKNSNVVIITSSLGEHPKIEYPAYSVGKAGLNAFMRIVCLELAKYNIRVNAVSPWTTKTPMMESIIGKKYSVWSKLAEKNPLQRVCKAEDTANVVLLLQDLKASFINGNIIYANGGAHLL